jgi:hypothetical protein
MHPDLLQALAKARHEDLLNMTPRTREQPSVRLDEHQAPFSRLRHRLGSLLIRAGARLIGDRRAALELAHE